MSLRTSPQTGVAIRLLSLPLRGWCSAQRIKIIITAGGSYTIMQLTLARPFPRIPSGHNPPVIPKANSEPVGDDAHIVPQMCRDILVRVDEGIDPYERALRSSLYTARSADWCGPFQGSPPATIRFLLMQVELRAEDEGFDCRSAGRRSVRSIRRGRRMATVHRTVAFR